MNLALAAKLAWCNTTDDWQRLAVRCAGITFAVVLMFMQNGFRNALFDSNVRVVEQMIDADIVIRTRSRFMLSSGQPIARDEVVKARNCPGVQFAYPLYIENMASELRPKGKSKRRIRVIAFDMRAKPFSKFGLENLAAQLEQPWTGAADCKSKPMFGFPERIEDLSLDNYGELAGKQIRLVGLFDLGIDFSNDGNLIVSPRNFARYFPFRGNGEPLSMADYGIVTCEPGADPTQVVRELQNFLGDSTTVQSKYDFLESEREFWGKTTPIGLIFMVGTLIGFAVGMIICYQVLATDIGDHMSEFATIKAMGYSPSFFAAVVVCQALLLAVVSFVPGALISAVAFEALNSFAKLGMFLDVTRLSVVLLLTVTMCVLSGFIAMRKLLSADPASLF